MDSFFTDPLFILLIGIIIVVGGIIGFRLHAFVALLIAAFVVAILTPSSAVEIYALGKGASNEAAMQMSNWHVGKRIATAFGETCGKIGILIAMAAIIGKCMLESGAAEKIIRSLIKWTGVKNAPISFLGGSFFLGIPVFFDTVFYLMLPLAKALANKLGKDYLLLVLAITAGAAMANSLVPPTPGPLFLISEMNIPIGMMMLGGTLVGLFTITTGYMYAVWVNRKWPVPLRDSVDAPLKDIKALSLQDDSHLPSLWLSTLPVLIPLVFITAKALMDTFVHAGASDNIILVLINFFGEKNTALISGGLSALFLLIFQKKDEKSAMGKAVQTALMSGGVIILITAAGGAFGAMLQQTGISVRIGDLAQGYQMAIIPLSFLIAVVVRTAQGSATVAMITAAGILAGMSATMDLGYHQLYLGLAIACGSKIFPWMNDSGFWIVCKMGNLTEKEVLKTFSPMLTIMGVTGLIVVMIASQIWPLV
jgi:GntP family gluconate:H+ symporter